MRVPVIAAATAALTTTKMIRIGRIEEALRYIAVQFRIVFDSIAMAIMIIIDIIMAICVMTHFQRVWSTFLNVHRLLEHVFGLVDAFIDLTDLGARCVHAGY